MFITIPVNSTTTIINNYKSITQEDIVTSNNTILIQYEIECGL